MPPLAPPLPIPSPTPLPTATPTAATPAPPTLARPPTPPPTSNPASSPTPTPTRAQPPSVVGGRPDVRISCIFYDGLVARSESDEYVEITNGADAPQDLAGWALVDVDDGRPRFIFPSRVMAPGSVVRVYTNQVHERYGGFSFGSGTAIWNNDEPDEAALYDSSGTLVSRKSYPPGC